MLSLEPLSIQRLDTDVGPQFIGAPAIWNGTATNGQPGTFGEGMVVGVIDSGVNWNSPSFADVGGDGFDHTNPLGAGNYLGVCEGQVAPDPLGPACNDKVIGAYQFSQTRDDIMAICEADPFDPDNPYGLTLQDCAGFGLPLINFDNAFDENGHGSHTASTAAGNQVDIVYQGNNLTLSGVARHANLVIYDGCFTVGSGPNAGGGSCFNLDTLAATDQIIEDDIIDVVNYSIGGGTQPWTSDNALAFLAATDSGVFISASAGNSGANGAGSVSHVEPWVMTVANGSHNRAGIAQGYSITGPGVPPANVVAQPLNVGTAGIAHTVPIPPTQLTVSPNFAMVPTANTGDGCLPFAAGTFQDDVALVRRGGCNFSIKATNARAAGAIAIIIASHPTSPNPENPIAPAATTPPGPVDVPVFGIRASQGTNLATFAGANPTATIMIPTAGIVAAGQGDVLNPSSSIGPSIFEMIKPDHHGAGHQHPRRRGERSGRCRNRLRAVHRHVDGGPTRGRRRRAGAQAASGLVGRGGEVGADADREEHRAHQAERHHPGGRLRPRRRTR